MKQLFDFIFSGTNFCEPTAPIYQIWKATVDDYSGTGLTCGDPFPWKIYLPSVNK